MKRLLIALPVAGAVVIGLFLAMREFVPAERPQADYRIIVSEHGKPFSRCFDCGRQVMVPRPYVERPETGNVHLPSPPRPRPEPGEPGEVPHEPFPEPERTVPDGRSLFPKSEAEHGSCAPGAASTVRITPRWPKDARDGDYVVLEFAISAEGCPTDIEVVESSNPKINQYAVRTAQRWRYRTKDDESERVKVRLEFREE